MIAAVSAAVWFTKTGTGGFRSQLQMSKVKDGDSSKIQKDKKRKETLNVASETMNGTINPVFTQTRGDRQISELIFEPLMRQQPDGTLEGILANKAEITDKGKIFTIHMKKNIKFSDGQKMTSEDVRASIMAAAFFADDKRGFENIKGYKKMMDGTEYQINGIEKKDENTVLVRFEKNSADNYRILETKIQSRKLLDLKNKENPFQKAEGYREGGIGTGPYKVSGTPNMNRSTLTLNRHYRGSVKDIEKVVFSHVNYYDLTSELKEGKLDVIEYNAQMASYEDIYGDGKYNIYSRPDNVMYFLGFNYMTDILNNPSLRQAIFLGLNREKALKEADKLLMPAEAFLPGSDAGKLPEYNKEKAGKLVQKAMKELDHADIVLRLPIVKNNKLQTSIADQLMKDMKEIGITIEVLPYTEEEYMQALYTEAGFDLYITNMDMSFTDRHLRALTMNRDGLPTEIDSKKLNHSIDALSKAVSLEDYGDKVKDCHKTLMEAMPVIPIAWGREYLSVSADLSGYSLNADAALIDDIHRIKVK